MTDTASASAGDSRGYHLDVVLEAPFTDALGRSIGSIDSAISANDDGLVAFLGRRQEADSAVYENLFTLDTARAGAVPVPLVDPFWEQPNPLLSDPELGGATQTFSPPRINNRGEVLSRRLTNSIVQLPCFPAFPVPPPFYTGCFGPNLDPIWPSDTLTAPFTYLEKWDALLAAQDVSAALYAMGDAGLQDAALFTRFLDPSSGAWFPSMFVPGSRWAAIHSSRNRSFPDLNRNGQVVFSALEMPSFHNCLVTTDDASEAAVFSQLLCDPAMLRYPEVQEPPRPGIADDGRVVARVQLRNGGDTTFAIELYSYGLSLKAEIASAGDFTRLGLAPGISSDGRIVAFVGELNTSGADRLNQLQRCDSAANRCLVGTSCKPNTNECTRSLQVEPLGPGPGAFVSVQLDGASLERVMLRVAATEIDPDGWVTVGSRDPRYSSVPIIFRGGGDGVSVPAVLAAHLVMLGDNLISPAPVGRPALLLSSGANPPYVVADGSWRANLYDGLVRRDRGDVFMGAAKLDTEPQIIRARPVERVFVEFEPESEEVFSLRGVPYRFDEGLAEYLNRESGGRSDLDAASIASQVRSLVQSMFDDLDASGAGLGVNVRVVDELPKDGSSMVVVVGGNTARASECAREPTPQGCLVAGVSERIDFYNANRSGPYMRNGRMEWADPQREYAVVLLEDIFGPYAKRFSTQQPTWQAVTLATTGVGEIQAGEVVNAIASVIAHEVGHLLGLAHEELAPDGRNLMEAGLRPRRDGLQRDWMRGASGRDYFGKQSLKACCVDGRPAEGLAQNASERLAFAAGSDVPSARLGRQVPNGNIIQLNAAGAVKTVPPEPSVQIGMGRADALSENELAKIVFLVMSSVSPDTGPKMFQEFSGVTVSRALSGLDLRWGVGDELVVVGEDAGGAVVLLGVSPGFTGSIDELFDVPSIDLFAFGESTRGRLPVPSDGARVVLQLFSRAEGGGAVFVREVVIEATGDTCGDGLLGETEECDDGNVEFGDGCSGFCDSNESCGNGNADIGEVCDDANDVAGDGCEPGCGSDGSCGNGIVDAREVCDDGNTVSGDGCRQDCQVLEGVPTATPRPTPTFPPTPLPTPTPTPAPVCGNGVREGGEMCDPGSPASGIDPDVPCECKVCRTDCLCERPCTYSTFDPGCPDILGLGIGFRFKGCVDAVGLVGDECPAGGVNDIPNDSSFQEATCAELQPVMQAGACVQAGVVTPMNCPTPTPSPSAVPTPVPNPVRIVQADPGIVGSPDAGSQSLLGLFSNGSGAWIAPVMEWETSTLWFVRSTDFGKTWSSRILVAHDDVAGELEGASPIEMVHDGAGNWLAMWISQGPTGLVRRLVKSTDEGVSWSNPVTLGAGLRGTLANDGRGQWGMAWREGKSILAARSADAGTSWGLPVVITPGTEAGLNIEVDNIHLDTDGDGMWLVCWTETLLVSGGFGSSIVVGSRVRVSRSFNNGGWWVSPVSVFQESGEYGGFTNGTWLLKGRSGRWVIWAAGRGWISSDNGSSWSVYRQPGLGEGDRDEFVVRTSRQGEWFVLSALKRTAIEKAQQPLWWSVTRLYGVWSGDEGRTWSEPFELTPVHPGLNFQLPGAEQFTDTHGEPALATDGQGNWMWAAEAYAAFSVKEPCVEDNTCDLDDWLASCNAGCPECACLRSNDIVVALPRQVQVENGIRAGLIGVERCGDGHVDPEEQCDDGNALDGDCCSARCKFDASGASCADSDLCDGSEVCDGAGACVQSEAPACDDTNPCTDDSCDSGTGCVHSSVADGSSCDDGNACTPTDGCVAGTCQGLTYLECPSSDPCTWTRCEPESGCVSSPGPAPADRTIRGAAATISVSDKSKDGADRLQLKLLKREATTAAVLGNPLDGTTSYQVCLWDNADVQPRAFWSTTIPAGGQTCGPKRAGACWKRVGSSGVLYNDTAKDPGGGNGGVAQLKAVAGRSGKGSLQVAGKGRNLTAPEPFDQATLLRSPVIAQVCNSVGSCWQERFGSSSIKRSRSDAFVAKLTGAPLCGNKKVEAGEGCDDGNTEDGDGCSRRCAVELCGDGILQGAEQCEIGNEAACAGTCLRGSCLCGKMSPVREEIAMSPERDDITSCDIQTRDSWRFDVVAGDAVEVTVNTVDSATAADLCAVVSCDDGFASDNEMPCAFTPPGGAGCPSTSFVSRSTRGCIAVVRVCSNSCASKETARYELRVKRGGANALVGLANDDLQ